MQNYQNHRRFYTPHHFIFYPVGLILFGISLYRMGYSLGNNNGEFWIWFVLSGAIFLIIWVAFMMRQHYALTLQNRIIVDEVKFRYFQLTGKSIDEMSYNFSDSQLFALRFANDGEFLKLVDDTISENLNADHMKKRIKNWKADNRRV
ncbi:hypothetical protein CMU96_05290 [Elizabethkingia anophelis]|nr:hypothetical protein [Elizabethkingia anophelis]MCT3812529.1 hypothetical protein [Elizabethkingia anophelis]MCT3819626.1 hypothetical protein [Elizabethkingia anophelis]MCT3942010.1 hypothetical protein [Elizabethkingia anophelis]MCT4194768.1 hypothetical protein [Elizabethkingia anophelis]